MFIRIVLFFCLILPGSGIAAGVVLVFGDSISAGYGLPREAAWVSLLERRLLQAAPGYKVVNASISGETTLGGRNRIEAALKTHRPAVVIVELGGNDGLRGAPIAAITENLEHIIEASQRSGARVVLVGMRLPPNYGTAYTEKFQQAYQTLAARHRTALVPFIFDGFADRREYFQPDGIHPTAGAQAFMLENVWNALAPLVTRGRR
jgi:acyl-CoA thioesterase-1